MALGALQAITAPPAEMDIAIRSNNLNRLGFLLLCHQPKSFLTGLYESYG